MVKISIIIPVFNAAMYLEQCLRSAVSQTVQEKEIICVDDGSTDTSRQIIAQFADQYRYIHCYAQENRGAGAARNLALEKATGEFVAFLDADDYYLDADALNIMYEACRNQEVDVCGSFRKILHNGQMIDFELHRDLGIGGTKGKIVDYASYQQDYYYQNYIFRRELIEKNDITFPLYRRYQDPPFFVKVMTAAQKFWVCPVELYCNRLGHQDFAGYDKKIDQTLMGIRDNMVWAAEHGFDQLQRILLDRVNHAFSQAILSNLSYKVIRLLVQIEESAMTESGGEIGILDEVAKRSRMFPKLWLSHDMYRRILQIHQGGLSFSGYLLEKGYTNIALYGLGTFGNILYNELRGTGINIVCGIDREKKEHGYLKIVPLDELPDKTDAVVVTPLEYTEIYLSIGGTIGVPLISFVEMVNEMTEGKVEND